MSEEKQTSWREELEAKIEQCRRELEAYAWKGQAVTELMPRFEAYCNEMMRIIEEEKARREKRGNKGETGATGEDG